MNNEYASVVLDTSSPESILLGIKIGDEVVECIEVTEESVEGILNMLLEWKSDKEKGSFLMPTLQLQ